MERPDLPGSRGPWLRAAYDAFNRRDVEWALERFDQEVEWPDLLAGRVLRGPDAVRAYWRRQFELISSHVVPTEIAEDETHAAVFVDQTVRDLKSGEEWRARIVHLWTFAGELVRQMQVFGDPEHPRLADFRRFHEHQAAYYAGGDAEPLAELLAPDAEWHVPGRNEIAGWYRGRDRVLEYFAKRRDLSGRTFTMDVREAFGADAGVVTLTFGRARVGGVENEWGTAGVYEFDGGRLTSGRLLPTDHAAFDAIWG
jgi:ketosteroid isomerase-like protein